MYIMHMEIVTIIVVKKKIKVVKMIIGVVKRPKWPKRCFWDDLRI